MAHPIHQMGVSSHNTEKHHSVLSDRCAAFLERGEYQNARRDAIDALKLDPNNIKYRCHLSKALLGLRSYTAALQELQYVKDSADDNVKSLLRRLPIYVNENVHGEYDFVKIRQEAEQSPRIFHADYCSALLELRKSNFGGRGGRGFFAKEDIPIGTLLVASKAIACVFTDEVTKIETSGPNSHYQQDFKTTDVERSLADSIYEMMQKGCGRAVLNLEGGINPQNLDPDLSRDDVYEETAATSATPDNVLEIILRNSFNVEKTVAGSRRIIGGQALFHVPSYFNHSCMPNTYRYQFGDMMFIRSATMIQAGKELFTYYTTMQNGESLKDRSESLRNRHVPFECHCQLCSFEKSNPNLANSAVELVQEMYRASSIQNLKAARLQLYKMFEHTIETETVEKIQTFSSQDPRDFAFARLLQLILLRLGYFLYWEDNEIEAMHYFAESFGISKENHLLSYTTTTFEMPRPALIVWKCLHHPAARMPRIVTSKWLGEAESMSSLVLGGGRFNTIFESFINAKS